MPPYGRGVGSQLRSDKKTRCKQRRVRLRVCEGERAREREKYAERQARRGAHETRRRDTRSRRGSNSLAPRAIRSRGFNSLSPGKVAASRVPVSATSRPPRFSFRRSFFRSRARATPRSTLDDRINIEVSRWRREESGQGAPSSSARRRRYRRTAARRGERRRPECSTSNNRPIRHRH